MAKREVCGDCEGRGYSIKTNGRCSACGGTGGYYVTFEEAACVFCSGTGETFSGRCDHCFGTGKAEAWAPKGKQEQSTETIRGRILTEAKTLTEGDRAAAYGDCKTNFERTAAIWSGLIGVEITAAQAALMMVAFKIDRAWRNESHHDSYVDAAAYAAIAGEIAERSGE